jgi:hypothetical protein
VSINDLLKTTVKALKELGIALTYYNLTFISDYKQKGQCPILAIVRTAEKRSLKQSIVLWHSNT